MLYSKHDRVHVLWCFFVLLSISFFLFLSRCFYFCFVLFFHPFYSLLFSNDQKKKSLQKKNDTQRNREIEREREREPHSMCLDIIFFHICFLKSEKEHEKKEFALVIDFSAFVWLLLLLIMMIMAMHQLRLFVS